MWLIDVHDLSLKQIPDRYLELGEDGSPPRYRYAILSHRWEDETEEPTFDEFQTKKLSHEKIGVRKIKACCQVAKAQELDLLWADTCCIDKRSSAELQESINSMYYYYQRAAVCFAYLRDVRDGYHVDSDLTDSEWFTRGWTLQELIAPLHVRFYNTNWDYLGHKKLLAPQISVITGIHQELLDGRRKLREYSVAQIMSWAAGRKTTRLEDRAYSLLGLFDVNLTMLYGEGSKAFIRLQEEILKAWDDSSLFVWEGIQPGELGLLAKSPDVFASSHDVMTVGSLVGRSAYVLTGRGVHGSFQLVPYTLDTYLMILPYYSGSSLGINRTRLVGIFLRRLEEDDQFARISIAGVDIVWDIQCGMSPFCTLHELDGFHRELNVRQRSLPGNGMRELYAERIEGFSLDIYNVPFERDFKEAHSEVVMEVRGDWDPETRILSRPTRPGCDEIVLHRLGLSHIVGSVDFGLQQKEIEMIHLGFDQDYNPVVYVTTREVKHVSHLFGELTREHFFAVQGAGSERTGPSVSFAINEDVQKYQNSHIHGDRIIPSIQTSMQVPGLWALKGSRQKDLNVFLCLGHDEVGYITLRRPNRRREIICWGLEANLKTFKSITHKM